MTDVRLTATNPEDSSVVPVACNSRGELLITDPVIEQIDNDLSIVGNLSVAKPSDIYDGVACFYPLGADGGAPILGGLWHNEGGSVCLQSGGYRGTSNNWVPFNGEASSDAAQIQVHNNALITFRTQTNKAKGSNHVIPIRFTVSDTGAASVDLQLIRPEDSRSWKPAISVFDELLFLRTQLRDVMEKLRLTPEGGWEVWDGSD